MLLYWLGLATAAAGAPWVRAPGESYTKLGWSWFTADRFVAPGGAVLDDTRYDGHSAVLYAELGLVPHVHGLVTLPAVGSRNTQGEVVWINRGLGDAQVGLVVGDTLGAVPVSLTLRGRLPLYDNDRLRAFGAEGARFPALGDGQVDLDAVAATGTGLAWGRFRGWTSAELGWRHRTEWWLGDRGDPDRALADGLIWAAQVGWAPAPGGQERGWLVLGADGVTSTVDDRQTRRLAQLSAGLGLRLWRGLALELGAGQVVWAEAAAPGRSLQAGASWTR